MAHLINKCHIKGAATYLFCNYRSVLKQITQTHGAFVNAIVTVIDFMLKMQKVKDSRIMDLWWAVGNTLKADCGRLRQACLSVMACK